MRCSKDRDRELKKEAHFFCAASRNLRLGSVVSSTDGLHTVTVVAPQVGLDGREQTPRGRRQSVTEQRRQ